MNRQEALGFFGIAFSAEADELNETIEWALFTQKQEMLKHSGIPLWLQARVKRIESLQQAAEILGFEMATPEWEGNLDLQIDDPICFIRSYELELSQIKLSISDSKSFGALKNTLLTWSRLLELYVQVFPKVMQSLINSVDEEVKQSESFDTALFLRQYAASGSSPTVIRMVSREHKRIDLW